MVEVNVPCEVDISDLYNACAVYASRRVGNKISWLDLVNKPGIEFTSWSNVKVCDIVCWMVDRIDHKSCATIITPSVHVLTPWIRVEKHFGVVEDWGRVSDLTFMTDSNGDQHPFIRLREYKNLRLPDFYFKL